MRSKLARTVLLVIGLVALPRDVFAYVGPGAGLTFIGALVAAVGAFVLAVVGFVWYPVKRLLRFFKASAKDGNVSEHQ